MQVNLHLQHLCSFKVFDWQVYESFCCITISKMEICGEGRNCSSTYCVRLARIVHHSCLFSSLYLEERPQASVWVGVGVVHFPSRINSTRFHHKKILVSVISKGSLTLKIWTKPFFHPSMFTVKRTQVVFTSWRLGTEKKFSDSLSSLRTCF